MQWAEQGVLLLNVCLTVRAHTANSHSKQGWEQFTDAAIGAINRKKRNVVFLLWGKSAELKAKGVDRGRHHVLTAAHPSGLSANRVGSLLILFCCDPGLSPKQRHQVCDLHRVPGTQYQCCQTSTSFHSSLSELSSQVVLIVIIC